MSESQLKPLVTDNPLAKLAKPAIRIKFVQEKSVDSEDKSLSDNGFKQLSPLSHLGGDPHLPKDFEWPCLCHGETVPVERPLVFSAQFDLSEIAPFDVDNLLPHKGLLVFFSAGECYQFSCWDNVSRIYYFEDIDSLEVTKRPTEPPFEKDSEDKDCVTMPFCRVYAKSIWTVPEEMAIIVSDLDFESRLSPFGLSKKQIKDFHVNYEDYFQELVDNDGFEEPDEVESQLLGWGQFIQADVIQSKKEQLLFTLSSFFDEKYKEYPICIGDAGAIYHSIELKQLKARDFSQVRSSMDCY